MTSIKPDFVENADISRLSDAEKVELIMKLYEQRDQFRANFENQLEGLLKSLTDQFEYRKETLTDMGKFRND